MAPRRIQDESESDGSGFLAKIIHADPNPPKKSDTELDFSGQTRPPAGRAQHAHVTHTSKFLSRPEVHMWQTLQSLCLPQSCFGPTRRCHFRPIPASVGEIKRPIQALRRSQPFHAAGDWLRQKLAKGSDKATSVLDDAKYDGFSQHTIRRFTNSTQLHFRRNPR